MKKLRYHIVLDSNYLYYSNRTMDLSLMYFVVVDDLIFTSYGLQIYYQRWDNISYINNLLDYASMNVYSM